MFDYFQKSYCREDFPWADLGKARGVSFQHILSTFDMWNKGRQSGSRVVFPCPFHVQNTEEILTVDLTSGDYSCTICTKNTENIVDFVHRLLPVQRVGAEMWLLQFVSSERERIMREYRHIIYWLNDCGKERMAQV